MWVKYKSVTFLIGGNVTLLNGAYNQCQTPIEMSVFVLIRNVGFLFFIFFDLRSRLKLATMSVGAPLFVPSLRF